MATIEFFYDISSPYTYLAATQVDALGERAGAEVVWRPFLLGGVFKATSNTMPARVQAKAAWMLKDLYTWAEHYGVPFQWPSVFPLNSLFAQRLQTAALAHHGPALTKALAMALFEAYWVHDRDLGQPEVLGEVAASVEGLDVEAVATLATTPEVKDQLRQLTDEATARGAFGAPTFFVGDAMFWGNDRMHFVESVARAAST